MLPYIEPVEGRFEKVGNIKNKSKVVKNLKALYKTVDDVIIATDIDREGEAIGYHVANALNLNIETTKRICFNEITKFK